MLHKNVRTLRNVFIQKIVESVPRIGSMINTVIMVNISRTAVTIGLLGNWLLGWHPLLREENVFYSRSRGIPAADSPAPDTPAGWRVVVLPAPTVLPRFSRGILPLPLPCKTLLHTLLHCCAIIHCILLHSDTSKRVHAKLVVNNDT